MNSEFCLSIWSLQELESNCQSWVISNNWLARSIPREAISFILIRSKLPNWIYRTCLSSIQRRLEGKTLLTLYLYIFIKHSMAYLTSYQERICILLKPKNAEGKKCLESTFRPNQKTSEDNMSFSRNTIPLSDGAWKENLSQQVLKGRERVEAVRARIGPRRKPLPDLPSIKLSKRRRTGFSDPLSSIKEASKSSLRPLSNWEWELIAGYENGGLDKACQNL